MEEWKDYHGYKVSNTGRVINRHGREIFGYLRKYKGYEYRCVSLRINKKKTRKNLNTLVCELFNPNYQKGTKVYQIDGNKRNCDFTNLKISRAYTTKPTAEQVKRYENEVINCVKHYFKTQNWIVAQNNGIDIDNALGNAYLLIWRYLPTFTKGTSFYSFCAKYCKIAFYREIKQEYKQRKIKEQK